MRKTPDWSGVSSTFLFNCSWSMVINRHFVSRLVLASYAVLGLDSIFESRLTPRVAHLPLCSALRWP